MRMRQEDRLGSILQELNKHGSVSVEGLSKELRVSESSVRRDLHLLETQKLLTRTHGGAVASGVLYEMPMRYRGGQRNDDKRAIARQAAALIPAGGVVAGLVGSTTGGSLSGSRPDSLEAQPVTTQMASRTRSGVRMRPMLRG